MANFDPFANIIDEDGPPQRGNIPDEAEITKHFEKVPPSLIDFWRSYGWGS